MEDEVKNVLVTIINLVINSGDAKAMVRHYGKPQSFMNNITTKLKKNQPIKIVKPQKQVPRIRTEEQKHRCHNTIRDLT
jgi:hypothetical protein